MAIGVALLTGLVAAVARPRAPRGRVLRWASRLLAAGLVAGGIVLAIDGVMGV